MNTNGMAGRYFHALWPEAEPPGHLAIWRLEGERTKWLQVDALDAAAAVAARNPADLYLGMGLQAHELDAHQRGKAADVIAIPALWVDLDVGKGKAPDRAAINDLLAALEFPPSMLVGSGSGGVHAYWLLKEPWLLNTPEEHRAAAMVLKGWETHVRTVAEQRYGFTIDTVSDLARILRIPGTVNCKNGSRRPVELLELHEDRRYDPSEFLDVIPIEEAPSNGSNGTKHQLSRWRASTPCPICGGHSRLPQGQGRRCWGYLDSTEHYARCTREELAGGLRPNNDKLGVSYSHLLTAPCGCGKDHRPVSPNGKPSATPATNKPPARTMATVEREHIVWLWHHRIPLGKVTVVDGMPGLGKSILHVDLAARISRGWPMPDDTPGLLGDVLVMAAEDGLGDTLLPRLCMAGADLKRIHAFGDDQVPIIPDELERIEATVREHHCRLIILDPLFAYVAARHRSISDQEMRQHAMTPLTQLAARTGAAVIIIRHLSKDREADAIARGAGSMGIIGAARAAFLVGLDPEDHGRRVLAATKSNLAQMASSLAFRITSEETDDAPRIVWEGATDLSAQDLLAKLPNEEERGALRDAKAYLLEALADHGLHSAALIIREAGGGGIAKRTLDRARALLGVQARKGLGQGAGWTWQMPWPKDQPPNGDPANF